MLSGVVLARSHPSSTLYFGIAIVCTLIINKAWLSHKSCRLLHRLNPVSDRLIPPSMSQRGAIPYLGPYLATYARLLGKGLPSLPGLPGALPGLPGPYLTVEHCTSPGLAWPSLCHVCKKACTVSALRPLAALFPDAKRPREPSVPAFNLSFFAVETCLLNNESIARNVLFTLFCVKP